MLLYYITDRAQFSGSELRRRELLVESSIEAAHSGIDYIQVREKDMSSRELESLARDIVGRVRGTGNATRVLINSRVDVALATGADGVHLRSNDISPADVRRIWKTAGVTLAPIIAVSCHTEPGVVAAKFAGADFVVFGPVFGKSMTPGVGLDSVRAACGHEIPVLALGGINAENAQSCLDAGAVGIAGIRLFQGGDLSPKVTGLRKLLSSC